MNAQRLVGTPSRGQAGSQPDQTPSHTDARGIYTGGLGHQEEVLRPVPVEASARGLVLGHVWAAGWRHRTIHPGRTPGAPAPHPQEAAEQPSGQSRGHGLPSPAQGISGTHLRRPASTTNCPWGLQGRWCWPVACRTSLEGRGLRGQRAAGTGATPAGVHTDSVRRRP